MTKKEAKARKMKWNQAIAEGRIVRFEGPCALEFKECLTAAGAQSVVAKALADGLKAEIVNAR